MAAFDAVMGDKNGRLWSELDGDRRAFLNPGHEKNMKLAYSLVHLLFV